MINSSEQTLDYSPQPARKSIWVLLVTITAAAIGLIFFISLAYFKSLDREDAATRLSLYQRSLNDTLERYQYLPFVLAQDPLVIETLTGVLPGRLNKRFSEFALESGLEAIYLMNMDGLVLASSNYNKNPSFVGQNYGFRPYFKEASIGDKGNYFGIGATTGRPGFFVSQPVRQGEKIIGVIAIKLDASELQTAWENSDENVLVSNADGIVVLASNRDWLFGAMKALSSEKLDSIKRSKQFGSESVKELNWLKPDKATVRLAGDSYTYSGANADYLNWQIHYLLGQGRSYERAILTTVVFGSGILVLVGFATFLRSRRIQMALARSQSDRDNLLKANHKLEEAHSELARTSKLAALGQLSASVVHELGQPISALRNYLTAAEIDQQIEVHPNQAKLNGVVDRMENITKQLRFFTKPGDHKMETIKIDEVVNDSLELMQHELRAEKIEVTYIGSDTIDVVGNRLRLEQVLVNLLKNAIHSLRETSSNKITVSLSNEDHHASLSVTDNGVGFGDRKLTQLQEPFHTTRASGDGMGLGLSIATEIIKEHGGTLSAANNADGGATFTVLLPVANASVGDQDE